MWIHCLFCAPGLPSWYKINIQRLLFHNVTRVQFKPHLYIQCRAQSAHIQIRDRNITSKPYFLLHNCCINTNRGIRKWTLNNLCYLSTNAYQWLDIWFHSDWKIKISKRRIDPDCVEAISDAALWPPQRLWYFPLANGKEKPWNLYSRRGTVSY